MVTEKALKRRNRIKIPLFDRVLSIIILIILTLVLISVAYPLIYIVSASISDPQAVTSGRMILWPVDITFEGYQKIFKNTEILTGLRNSVIYTAVGVAINLVMTILGAYPLSRKDLRGRNMLMSLMAFTMYFSGGMIPNFLIVKAMGLYNSMWALVIPPAISVYNLIVMRTFFETSIPCELLEASRIDGCDDYQYLFKILLPLSMPILAVMFLFYASAHWNMFFDAIIYIRKPDMYPLQVILRNILLKNIMTRDMMQQVSQEENLRTGEIIKYGLILVSAVPMMVVYPFVQKYFAKGMMIGSIKG